MDLEIIQTIGDQAMNAYTDLFNNISLSDEVIKKIETLLKEYEFECQKLADVRTALRNLNSSTLSVLFDQMHWAQQNCIKQDIDQLDNKMKDTIYSKLTANFWMKVNNQILKDIYNCSVSVTSKFNNSYYYQYEECVAEFTPENVKKAILESLNESKLTNALMEQLEIFNVENANNTFKSGNMRTKEKDLTKNVSNIMDLHSVLNELCMSVDDLKTMVTDIDEDFYNETELKLKNNVGIDVYISPMISAKLFQNGNVLITLDSRVSNKAHKYISMD